MIPPTASNLRFKLGRGRTEELQDEWVDLDPEEDDDEDELGPEDGEDVDYNGEEDGFADF